MERLTVLGYKTILSTCCFLVAIKFFSHFIGICQCKYAVRFEMKSREEVNRMQLTNQALRNKTQ